jgi:hypothetical protein
MNVTILDNLIAVVLVILSLSLVVQSVQAVLKKLLKIKSRQLEQSLVDLFRIAIGTGGDTIQVRMPILQVRSGPAGLPPKGSPDEVRVLYDAVLGGFQEIGRVAASGKCVISSLTKEDLLKILQRVHPDLITPGKIADLQRACEDVSKLGIVLDEARALVADSGVAAKLAIIQEKFTPLLNDVKRIFDGQAISKKVIIEDLVNLRGLRTAEVLEIVASAERKVVKDRSSTADGSPERVALDKVVENLKNLGVAVATAGQSAEAGVGILSARIEHIENWYDTIMQSFSERYNRSMRTWVIVLGFVVAFALNADLFSIYRNISADSTTRQLILSSRETLTQRLQPTGAAGQTAAQAAGTPPESNVAEALRKARQDVIDSTSLYSSYGFGWPTKTEDWSNWNFGQYVVGCFAMGLLLSVGAPFWEDALESLFGIKNLLGKRSGTAPAAASATQPRP